MAKKNSQKPKLPTIEELTLERNELLISGNDPERLSEIKKFLDYFNWGIK